MTETTREPGMPNLDPETWERPVPDVDNVSRPFWEAAARGELLLQECPSCGHRQFYPRAMCTACGADPEWRTASGRGTVHTYTVVRQNGTPPYRDELPYVVAMIDLEEGVRMMGNVVECPPDDVRVGLPVEVFTVKLEDGLGIPFWRPAAAGRS